MSFITVSERCSLDVLRSILRENKDVQSIKFAPSAAPISNNHLEVIFAESCFQSLDLSGTYGFTLPFLMSQMQSANHQFTKLNLKKCRFNDSDFIGIVFKANSIAEIVLPTGKIAKAVPDQSGQISYGIYNQNISEHGLSPVHDLDGLAQELHCSMQIHAEPEPECQAENIESADFSSNPINDFVEQVHKSGVWRIFPLGSGGFVTLSYDKSFGIHRPGFENINVSPGKKAILCGCEVHQNYICVGGNEGKVTFWNIEGQQSKLDTTLELGVSGAYSLAFLSQSNQLLVGSCQTKGNPLWKHYITVFDLGTMRRVKRFEAHEGGVSSILDLCNGNFATVSADRAIKIWNNTSFDLEMEIPNAHEDYIYTSALIGENRMVTGSKDTTIKVWDLLTYKCIAQLGEPRKKVRDSSHGYTYHTNTVYNITPLGSDYFASSSRDGSMKIWNAYDFSLVQTLDIQERYLYSLAATKEGLLIGGDDKGNVITWAFKKNQQSNEV
jgi:WD40 repeat protein